MYRISDSPEHAIMGTKTILRHVICAALTIVAFEIHAMSANGMQNIGKLTMSNVNNGGLYSAAIDSTNGFAYIGGKHFITKIDIKGAVPVEIGSIAMGAQIAAVIDVAAGYGYFCSGANVYRISLGAGNAAPVYVDTLTLSTTIWGAVIDTSDPSVANHYIYCDLAGSPASVVKISVATFNPVGSVTLNAGETKIRRGAIDTQNGYAYFVGPLDETAPPFVVKVALGAGSAAPTRVGAVQLDSVTHGMGSAVVDVTHGYAYFGTYGSVPAIVYKMAVGSGNAAPTLAGSVVLSAGTGAQNGPNAAERELCTAVIDSASGFAYFGTDHTYPAKIFQIALGSGNAAPLETGVLQLTGGTHPLGEPSGPNDGEQFLPRTLTEDVDYGEVFTQSSVVDLTRGDASVPGSHYAYFGCDSYAGQVVKVLIPPPPTPVAPSILNGPPPGGTVGTVYAFSYTSSGSPPPTFAVASGSLPAGLALSSAGVVSGTPTSAGTFKGSVAATNGVIPDFTQAFSITINASSSPVTLQFSSPAAAAPGTAGVNQPVSFSAGSIIGNGSGPVTWSWDFGDGSADSGTTVSHVFAAPGVYTVTVTATAGGQTVTSSVSVVVNAPLVGVGNDSDGDGFSDAVETALGSDPTNGASTPLGLPASAGAIKPLNVSKASIKLNFAATGKDSISFSGTLAIPAGFKPQGAAFQIDVSGVARNITLGSKGLGSAAGTSAKLMVKAKKGTVQAQTAKYSVTMKGAFAAALAAAGFTNSDTKAAATSAVFTLLFNASILQKSQALTYTAKKGKTGMAKK